MSELQFRASQPPAIWRNNPVLVQLLGLSPLLAISTSLVNGVGLGVATLMVLVLASITISLCQKLINTEWRFAIFLFVLAVYTTIIDIIMQRYFYALYRELGIYVPLVCCNMALLLHLETQANQQPWPLAIRSSATAGLGYLLCLMGFAALREMLISGHLGDNWQLLLPGSDARIDITSGSTSADLFRFIRMTPVALILLGLILALRNWLTGEPDFYSDEQPVTPAPRARVTGKIQSS